MESYQKVPYIEVTVFSYVHVLAKGVTWLSFKNHLSDTKFQVVMISNYIISFIES